MTSPADLPSRELDAAVAREVMGWTDVAMETLAFGEQTAFGRHPHSEPSARRYPVPYYSKNGIAMLTVLDALRERGLRPVCMPDWRDQWQCVIYRENRYIVQSEWHKSLPRAVSEAALAAVGGK